MKNILLMTVIAAGILNSVQAQRGTSQGDRSRSNVGQSRTERSYRNVESRSGNARVNSSGNYNRIINNTPQRNDVALRDINRRDNYSSTQQRIYRGNSDIGRVRYPSQNIGQRNVVQRNYNTYNSYGRNYYGGGYYPRYSFMRGPRYTVLPRSSISIYFGGYPYYYNSGFFYGRFGGYYEPLFPPIGIHIGVLPFGYSRIFIGADLFYYFNGIYYRHNHERKDYEVVDAPMGATVSSLPKGAKSVVLNGEKLYMSLMVLITKKTETLKEKPYIP
jgi:hypothetical protein